MSVVGCRNRKLMKVALKDLPSLTDEKSYIYPHYKTYTRESFHILKKIRNRWKSRVTPYSPFSNERLSNLSKFRIFFFKYCEPEVFSNYNIFFTDRISHSGLTFINRNLGLKILDMGNITWRYYQNPHLKYLIIESIKNADIIIIPLREFKKLEKSIGLLSFHEINPSILMWVIFSNKSKILAFHGKVGEIELSVPKIKNLIDYSGAKDAFTSMLIYQLYNLLENRFEINKLYELNNEQFKTILNNCLENARKSCLFFGTRTYLYKYLENKNNISLKDFLFKPLTDKDYLEDSIDFITKYGESIF